VSEKLAFNIGAGLPPTISGQPAASRAAKLHRVSRSEDRICDNPTATKFTIHILAAVAEHERDAISARTKAALAAAKANGKKLGNYQRIAEAKQRATAARVEAMREAIAETAHLSARVAADALNRRGIKTASGKQWHAMTVLRTRHRLGV
jgi:DNA invertase Pin-like site-specific DNA recombinase